MYISILDDFFNNIHNITSDYVGRHYLVDKEKYDVIEKPEWKKQRLENEKSRLQSLVDFYQSAADDYLKCKKNAEELLKKATEELDKL